MNAHEILGPGGPLAQAIAGYEHREAQLEMADLVECCIQDQEDAVIEAGTGSGKSFAYLAPAILSHRQAIVSTANKTLQAQLIQKDLPTLQRILGGFSFAVAKGKGNYLCRRKLAKLKEYELRPDHWRWINRSETGDIEEAPFEFAGSPEKCRELCAGDDCLRKKCGLYDQCFYFEAKNKRRCADIVVTNHALLCQHALHGEDAGILPGAPILVVDEAHQLESYAINARSVEVSSYSFRGSAATWADQGHAFLDCLAEGMGKRDDVLISPKAKYPEGLELAASLRQIAEGQNTFDADFDEGAVQQAREELLSLADRCEMLSKETPAGYVRHTLRRNNNLVGQATCYDVSTMLSALRERFRSVIYTSATLTTGPEDFRYFTVHNGVSTKMHALQVGSPFDYRRQALLYLPATMPEPDYQHRDIFDEAARQEMTALVKASGGGAMLLFTSCYAMNAAADYLARALALAYPVRRQGEAPKPALIEWLKACHDGVLCATASFWEGVDIPGESLRLLVIDKIPFAQPTPVEMARQGAAGRNAFMELSVPEATLRLKQGFGRLIRTRSDYGVVAMLDPRLWLKDYGRRIVGALPDARVVRSVGEVAKFYEKWGVPTAVAVKRENKDPFAIALAELMEEQTP